ncbi:MAG: PEP/pyruvate-binding domain-containing protein [Caulobacteraceae bacterium]
MSDPVIAWFDAIGLQDRPAVGGKGGSLGELTRAGIAVPPGFVVRTEAFEQFIVALDAAEPLRALVEALDPNDLEQVQAVTAAIRARVEQTPLPDAVDAAIRTAWRQLAESGQPVAVRSSATTEDAEDASFAGLQDTYLWVLGEDQVIARTRSCWASLYSVESVCYRRKHGLPEAGVAMGVVIQCMVDARCAGVMFTRSPTTGDRSVITIEGAWGLGSAVVSGEVTPDRWVVAKLTGEIPVRDISDKHIRQVPAPGGGIRDEETPDDLRHAPCLSDAELQRLKDIARQAERHYGRPQDIEWAVENGSGAILLLQSRPETVWSVKETPPAAAPQANPLHHLMTVFGGRK